MHNCSISNFLSLQTTFNNSDKLSSFHLEHLFIIPCAFFPFRAPFCHSEHPPCHSGHTFCHSECQRRISIHSSIDPQTSTHVHPITLTIPSHSTAFCHSEHPFCHSERQRRISSPLHRNFSIHTLQKPHIRLYDMITKNAGA